ncbi:MAG: CvpA family protein [Eubacteriales bacterium]|nr:CvpA family protein [Eubacteriales bacterium]MDD4390412.1 CvpA family protein [Eubacteriales bacterium]
MIFDVIIGAVIVISMVLGFRSGVIHTFIHTMGWIISLLLAFVFSPKLELFLLENTNIYLSIEQGLSAKLTEGAVAKASTLEGLPMILFDAANEAANNLALSFADRLADALFSIICFLIVIAGVKLFIWLFMSAFSKKNAGGFTGFIDGSLGMATGFLRGLILAFIILALLVPYMGLCSLETYAYIISNLDESYFAGILYDNNLILLIIQDLF